jgi:tetratricopeptide (TPR) repeat protein
MRIIVSGTGNLKLIKQPVINLPKDFDKYEPKVTEQTKLTTAGIEGSKIYDVLIVPRHQGKYDIPPVEFTYFDTSTKRYETVKTETFHLDVAKGSGASAVSDFSGQDELQELNKDIRFIKTGEADQHLTGDFFFGSTAYWITIAALVLVFITLFVIFRQRAIDNANVTAMRGKKANKVATKRLKQAARLMTDNKPGEFYDEVLRALWGYVGDKLNIPVAQLSHDNISSKLAERGVHQSIIDKFIGALDECEFERYAPGDPKGNMSKVYDKAMLAIEKIEEVMKRGGRKSVVTIAMLLMLLPMAANAATKAEADSAYVNGNYQEAIKAYESLLKQGESAELYYNLGNAYYRTENITRAVLNYERALLLSPGDGDIRFNLQIARSKTIDKIVPESEMFFVTWYRSLVNIMSVDGWGRMALVSLALVIVLFLVYLFSARVWVQKVGFFGGGFLLFVFVLSNFFAWQQRQQLLNREGAIVVAPSVTVKSTPAQNGTDLFILHEGTKVVITDSSMKSWREIRLADGKKGWIESKKIELI